jgi:hypothetical protein
MSGVRGIYLLSPHLPIHVEEKPQTKNGPQHNERETAVMNHALLMLIALLGLWILGGRHRGDLSHIFTTLIAIIVALG